MDSSSDYSLVAVNPPPPPPPPPPPTQRHGQFLLSSEGREDYPRTAGWFTVEYLADDSDECILAFQSEGGNSRPEGATSLEAQVFYGDDRASDMEKDWADNFCEAWTHRMRRDTWGLNTADLKGRLWAQMVDEINARSGGQPSPDSVTEETQQVTHLVEFTPVVPQSGRFVMTFSYSNSTMDDTRSDTPVHVYANKLFSLPFRHGYAVEEVVTTTKPTTDMAKTLQLPVTHSSPPSVRQGYVPIVALDKELLSRGFDFQTGTVSEVYDTAGTENTEVAVLGGH